MTPQAARREFVVKGASVRLDQFLAGQEGLGLTRSRLHGLISEGLVWLNGRPGRPSQRVKAGDRISLTVPPPKRLDIVPQEMPLAVTYQDDQVVVIDKPAGLSVHPGPGHPDRTLVNALLALCPDIKGVGGAIRPGIVHRLDKDTSGLIMAAKTEEAHRGLSQQVKDRQVTKGYLALVKGVMAQAKGTIDAPITRDPRNRKRMAVVAGGKEARTRFRVLEVVDGHSLVELYLETGRTHQVRVHLAYMGHPLLGDSLYGKASPLLGRQFLHAHHLAFQHPERGEVMEFRSGLPEDLEWALAQLRAASGQT